MISISPCGTDPIDARDPNTADDGDRETLYRPDTWLDAAQQVHLYSNARSAIWSCLMDLRLSKIDEVCIQTTSNGPYISSCVTKTIEHICSWSRKITNRTKLVFVIHEFGFPCDEHRMQTFRGMGIPILEDCAYAIGSRLEGAVVGRYGDYAVYSLPKYYPVEGGGILACKKPMNEVWNGDPASPTGRHLSNAEGVELLSRIACSETVKHHWNRVRRDNWRHFARSLTKLGVEPYFDLEDAVVPGVFVCSLPSRINGQALKKKFVDAGVEATEYYGHGGFYFPAHQFLSEHDVDMMIHLFGEVQ